MADRDWAVELEASGAASYDYDLADRVLGVLADHSPALSFHCDRMSVRFDVEGANPFAALMNAQEVLKVMLPDLIPGRVVVGEPVA